MIKRIHAWLHRSGMQLEGLSLQTRLIISYVVIILLPMTLISTLLFNEFNQNYIRDIWKKSEYMLEIEKVNTDNNIETMERIAQLTISDKEVLHYIQRNSEPDPDELMEFNAYALSNIVRNQYANPNIEHIRIYSNNDYISELWPVFFHEKRIAQKYWYPKVLAAGGLEHWEFEQTDTDIIRRYTTEREKGAKISIFRNIEYPQGRHAGILQIDMLLNHFFPKTFSTVQEHQSQMFVADRALRMYYKPDSPFLEGTGLDPRYLLAQLAKREQAKDGHFEFKYQGSSFLCTYIYLDRLDAYMLNVVSLNEFFTNLSNIKNWLILANIVLIIILSVSTYFLNSLILKKLRILIDSMKKARKGDFNFDIDIRAGGEIGELVLHFRKMLSKLNGLIADAVRKNAITKEAELKTLKNQIDAHFLYNSLENIKMLAEIENQIVIADALTSLGGMMRYNMKWTSEYVRLQDEINHIKNYIAIMNIRFDDCISLRIDIDPADLEQEVLKMSLQPIVENSVKHGMKSLAKAGRELTIVISAVARDGEMVIRISDNGCGMPAERAELINRTISLSEEAFERQQGGGAAGPFAGGSGIGLRNVNWRIRLYYGEQYGIRLDSKEGLYTDVYMRIPYMMMSGGLTKHA